MLTTITSAKASTLWPFLPEQRIISGNVTAIAGFYFRIAVRSVARRTERQRTGWLHWLRRGFTVQVSPRDARRVAIVCSLFVAMMFRARIITIIIIITTYSPTPSIRTK